MKKNPWEDRNGKFEVRTCRGVEAYLKHKTGLADIKVHKTDRYLHIDYLKNGKMHAESVAGPFIYCINEEDFAAVISRMMRLEENKTFELTPELKVALDQILREGELYWNGVLAGKENVNKPASIQRCYDLVRELVT